MPQVMTTAATAGTSASRAEACQRVQSVLADWRGRAGIVVFGAGAHTSKVLSVLEAHADKIVGIVDDSPAWWSKPLGPWTVGPPAAVIDENVAGILVSSDTQQRVLAQRVQEEFGDRCAILTLYETRGDDGPELPFTGERQIGRNLDEIELGHRARYYWALQHLPAGAVVLDAACGNGYGSYILASGGARVQGVDVSAEAIAFARHYYRHEQTSFVAAAIDDASALCDAAAASAPFDALVSLETLEHLADAETFLHSAGGLLRPGGMLLCSTPNADVMDIAEAPYHQRHFTRTELQQLLRRVGFQMQNWYGQEGLQILNNRCTTRQRYLLYHALKSV